MAMSMVEAVSSLETHDPPDFPPWGELDNGRTLSAPTRNAETPGDASEIA
jgi:hypothetical protein